MKSLATSALLKLLDWMARAARGFGNVPERLENARSALFWRTLPARIARLEAGARRRWSAARARGSGPRSSGPEGAPLVSVILPTYDRAHTLGEAIQSVLDHSYPHWELLVADDGSSDDTARLVERFQSQCARVHHLAGDHRGHSAARNRALSHCKGEVITYLDSDNTWYPDYLQTVVDHFAARPDCESLYLADLVIDVRAEQVFVRCERFDAEALEKTSLIDLNVFAHRRTAYERHGGFDEGLTRLADWELIRRYTSEAPALRVPALGARYVRGAPDSVTENESLWHNHYLVQLKRERLVDRPVRVLYALWHYPQLSEAYVRWEIEYARRRGVEVEVWSETDSAPAPFATDVPIHHGTLPDAIRRVRPDVLHVHWGSRALAYLGWVREAGLSMTVRGHGFDFTPKWVDKLVESDAVQRICLFPHQARAFRRSQKVRRMPAAFSGAMYPPAASKDPRLVFRAGAALPTKDLATFFQAALRCPEHRFVLALAVCARAEAYAGEIQEYNASLGSPVDLRLNVPMEEVAQIMSRAGIYLHTHGLIDPYGMPISIAEAMATGCLVVARRCPAAEEYVADAGLLYDDVEGAVALLHETTRWSEDTWRRAQRRAIDRAYERFVDLRALAPLVDDWLDAGAQRQGGLAHVARRAAS